ncbi:hypothetical protein SAMN05216386_0812 [Nitrosospira briensis]|uniref:Uncharacterized protein n=1 Tax=Nitrosospira briensis TaxID=35799 RepID=A0A1I4YPH6_9PROT|nr:choice-of-anchor K domain-containing protein [Nitrosospira briensis]SFN39916.1 hypothetical protein SAMN05216386_0812 [Nitrosospira briensis]
MVSVPWTLPGASFDATPGTPFTLGCLTFHNGEILSGTGADSVNFRLAINFDNVPEKNLVLETPFHLTNTPNVDDPVAAADFVSIGNFNFTFNVFEGNTASVDILATLSTGLTATMAQVCLLNGC